MDDTLTISDLLHLLAEHVKLGEPMGCGNLRCSLGCNMGYENVPNPHVYGELFLVFERDAKKGCWQWQVEIVPMNKQTGAWMGTGDNPLEVLRRAYAWILNGRSA